MRLRLVSWGEDGDPVSIQTTQFEAWERIGLGNGAMTALPSFLDMGEYNPALAGKTLQGAQYTLQMHLLGDDDAELEAARDAMNNLFRVSDFDMRILIGEDIDDADTEWYLEGFVVTPPILQEGAMKNLYNITIALKVPYWRLVTPVATSFNIGSTTETNNVTVAGNAPALPVITVTPRDAKGSAANRNRFFCAVHPPAVPRSEQMQMAGMILPRYRRTPIDLTPSGWDTAALILGGDMLASGDDVRVVVNGVEQPRWFGGGGIDDANTHVWTYLSMPFFTEVTLETTLDNSTTPSSIVLEVADSQHNDLLSAPGIILIGSELITYTSETRRYIPNAADPNRRYEITLSGLSRGEYNTVKAAHAINDVVYPIKNEVWIIYGNPDATAPDEFINEKPAFDLVNSTNSEWIYDGRFSNQGASSPLYWSNTPSRRGPGLTYTNEENVGTLPANEADPFEVTGLKLVSTLISGIVYSDTTSRPSWLFIHDGLIDTVDYAGQRYRSGTEGGLAQVGYQITGGVIRAMDTLASPTLAATWEPFSDTLDYGAASLFLSTFGVVLSGGLGTTLPVPEAMVELNYVSIVPRYLPVVFTPAAVITTSYQLSGYIENSVNEHRISFRNIPMLIDDVLTIDCENMTASISDGRDARPYLQFDGPVRDEWMVLEPGVNPIVFYDVDTTDVDITFTVSDRNTT